MDVFANIAAQVAEEKPTLKTIVIDVHNDRDLIDMTTTPAKQFRTVLDNLEPELAKHGLTPIDATYDDAVDRFKRLEV